MSHSVEYIFDIPKPYNFARVNIQLAPKKINKDDSKYIEIMKRKVAPKNKISNSNVLSAKANDITTSEVTTDTNRKQEFLDLVRSPAQQRRATLRMVVEEAANLQQALATLAAKMPERKHKRQGSDSADTPTSNGGDSGTPESKSSQYSNCGQKRTDRKSKFSGFCQALNSQTG